MSTAVVDKNAAQRVFLTKQNYGEKMKSKIIKIVSVILIVAVFTYATIRLMPIIKSGEIVDIIRSSGAWGVLIFLGLQLLQIFAAFIPGEPFELAAGVLYGPWLGLLFCLIGVALGTVAIYYGVQLLGAKSIENNPKFDKFRFLKNPETAYRLIFILFLIPGTPKDILTYFGPFIPIKPRRFFVAAVLGRIPSIITSTLAGSAFYDGNLKMSIIYFLLGALLAGIGLLVNAGIEKKYSEACKENVNNGGQK